jgi:hypothetical protein
MKRKDLTLIAVIAVVAGIFSLIISNLLISSPKNRQQKVEVVDAITQQFNEPDKRYFNGTAGNPTALIRINDNANPAPFTDQ